MRKIAIIMASAAALAAAPAYANDGEASGEGRAEVRTGVAFGGGDGDLFGGIAAGYDFDLGKGAFAGVEVTADKIFANNTRVTVGGNVRVGTVTEGGGKLYITGGYQTKPCSTCENAWSAGGGVQFPFGETMYGKVEYRHFFSNNAAPNLQAVAFGVGMRF